MEDSEGYLVCDGESDRDSCGKDHSKFITGGLADERARAQWAVRSR